MQATDGAFRRADRERAGTLGPFASADAADVCVRGTDVAGNTSSQSALCSPSSIRARDLSPARLIASPGSACPVFCRGKGTGHTSHWSLATRTREPAGGRNQFPFSREPQVRRAARTNGSSSKATADGRDKGTGELNGRSGYSFSSTVYDGRHWRGNDGIRMKITDSNGVVYDNGAGASDADIGPSSTRPISGGEHRDPRAEVTRPPAENDSTAAASSRRVAILDISVSELSVIVASHNARDYIERCLEALSERGHDLIVVDSASSDGTANSFESASRGAPGGSDGKSRLRRRAERRHCDDGRALPPDERRRMADSWGRRGAPRSSPSASKEPAWSGRSC